MFERFTERAQQTLVLTQEEARALKHNYVGTEHLLLGLIREEHGLAARVLASFGVTEERVHEQIVRIVGQGEELAEGPLVFTPRLKKVCELALREALSLGHNYISTEHILLGLVRENEGVGARILMDFDVDDDKVRNEIIRMLSMHRVTPVEGLGEPNGNDEHVDPWAFRAILRHALSELDEGVEPDSVLGSLRQVMREMPA